MFLVSTQVEIERRLFVLYSFLGSFRAGYLESVFRKMYAYFHDI